MESRVRSNFGRYEILSDLGRGAMGVVYKARDPKIDRLVAIKTVFLGGHDPEEEKSFCERFMVEARAAGRLQHPNIVNIFDVSEDSETQAPYIVMEYVAGRSLEEMLRDRTNKISLEIALSLCEQLAEALGYAHQQGIVHRDIKPANILVTANGQAKIADFGIAKMNTAALTLVGQGVGTPAYSSPEQVSGEAVDGRSDLFSLGVVLFSMVTGHRPFQGNSAYTVSFKVMNQEPISVCALQPDLPEQLGRIVSKALAKEPAERYQTGAEMAHAIKDLRALIDVGLSHIGPYLNLTSRTKEAASTSVAMAGEAVVEVRAQEIKSLQKPSPRNIPPQNAAAAPSRISGKPVVWPAVAVGTLFFVACSTLGIKWVSKRNERNPPAAAALQAVRPRVQHVDIESEIAAAAAPVDQPEEPEDKISPEKKSGHITAPKHDASIGSKPKVAEVAATAPLLVPTAAPLDAATMHIHMRHHLEHVQLFVWVDDKLSFKVTSDGTIKKRLGLFKTTQGDASDSFSLAPGSHRIRVRVESPDNAYDESGTIDGNFPKNGERALLVDCQKQKAVVLSLQ